MADDLKRELQCRRLDGLIISGDVASFSEPEEYSAAREFIQTLQKEFDIKPDHIIIAPGNHDLNWPLAKKGYILKDREECPERLEEGKFIPVGDDVIRLRDEEKYTKRFRHFSEFHEALTGRPYPEEYEAQGVITHLAAHDLLILSLNSAWQVDHHFTTRAGIHPGAVARALDRIRTMPEYEKCRKFAVWHHPLESPDPGRITDHGFMERLAQAGFTVAFHGHIHKAGVGSYRYDVTAGGRGVRLVGAGTFGAPTREWTPGYPLQYNFLKLEGNEMIVETRCRREPNGAWGPDAIWRQGEGKDPLPRYVVKLPGLCRPSPAVTHGKSSAHSSAEEMPVPTIPGAYREWLEKRCANMDIDRLREKARVIAVKLPQLYIPLYAYPPEKNKRRGPGGGMEADRQPPANIEDFFLRSPHLLIKGQPGSGKTTLFKHAAIAMLQDPPAGGEWLPVLIFLKDLRDFAWNKAGGPAGAATAEEVLTWYFDKTRCGLDLRAVRDFCRARRALFLVDGLDEIDRERRDFIAESLAEFQRICKGGNLIFSGRPHGLEGAVIDRFGDRHVEILPLGMEQVEAFIHKWFCYLESEGESGCAKSAQDLIAEIKAHPAINDLKDTPLMLTAICLLYSDGRELPGQRAELYKKFIGYLLHRRFPDPEKVHRYLQELAFDLHGKRTRGTDRLPAEDVLGKFFPRQEGEAEVEYNARLSGEFDRIESHCGLMKTEPGSYCFWHLTFQEFLTATALVDRERRDHFAAIHQHWDDDWYKEVVELFVGYLSIQNMGMANEIVKQVLDMPDRPPYERWRLAARSLHDIHQDRREPEVITLAQKRLQHVIISDAIPAARAEAGETLGRLGDPRDLKEFIEVAGGTYRLTQGKAEIAPFALGKYPVTNGWFAEFIKAGGYHDERYWSGEGRKWLARSEKTAPHFWHDRQWNCPNAPVVGVTWYEAHAFTKWLTEEDENGFLYFLPDESQWEAAAAGKNGREFPWPGEWRKDHCNMIETGIKKTSSVGIFPQGDTPEGIGDLAGNVWEWTRSDRDLTYTREDFAFDPELHDLLEEINTASGNRRKVLGALLEEKFNRGASQLPVLRGNSWVYDRYDAICADHLGINPEFRTNNVGFRCAKTKS